MASSKPLQDTNNIHIIISPTQYGQQQQQQQQHIPIIPSPLNPSGRRPASLPRRHTVSGVRSTTPAPNPLPAATTPTAATPIPRPVRHTRRHSGSSLSPTERLMRYKGALAWRSATGCDTTFQRIPVQSGGPRPHAGDGGITTSLLEASNTQKGGGGLEYNKNTATTTTPKNPVHHHHHHDDEKADFHVVILDPPTKEEQTQGAEHRQKRPPRSPLSYHPVEYYTNPPSPRTVVRRPRPRHGPSHSGHGTTTTTTTLLLQRASFLFVALLFGIYMILHAFSLVFSSGHGHGHGTNSPGPGNHHSAEPMTGGGGRNISADV